MPSRSSFFVFFRAAGKGVLRLLVDLLLNCLVHINKFAALGGLLN